MKNFKKLFDEVSGNKEEEKIDENRVKTYGEKDGEYEAKLEFNAGKDSMSIVYLGDTSYLEFTMQGKTVKINLGEAAKIAKWILAV